MQFRMPRKLQYKDKKTWSKPESMLLRKRDKTEEEGDSNKDNSNYKGLLMPLKEQEKLLPRGLEMKGLESERPRRPLSMKKEELLMQNLQPEMLLPMPRPMQLSKLLRIRQEKCTTK